MRSETDRDPVPIPRRCRCGWETIHHLREDIEKLDELQLEAMFETAAEVGLKRAFSD